MRVNKAIRENLRFLVVEVGSQVTNLKAYLATGSPPLAQRILDRSGYAYNLKMRIHDGCVKQLSRGKNPEGGTLSLRAMESIAT
ncbi:MAG: phosphate uptake regulator, PhoU, partial [Pseudomonadota bacterium]